MKLDQCNLILNTDKKKKEIDYYNLERKIKLMQTIKFALEEFYPLA